MNRLAHVISTSTANSIASQLFAYGANTPGSVVWPAANDAIFVPFCVTFPAIVLRMYIINGATATGNVDVGIYTEDGARVVSMGSTAQSGTTAPQYFNITDTQLAIGNYYMALAMDGTSGTNRRYSLSIQRCSAAGLIKATSSFPLPASVTFATMTAVYAPTIGLDLVGTLT